MNEIIHFFTNWQQQHTSASAVLINILLGFLLAWCLTYAQAKLNNHKTEIKQNSNIYIILTLSVLLIVVFIRTSLHVSVGLIGALSIIRFRSTINDTQSMIFLFLAITIGVGLGVNERVLTILALVLILGLLFLHSFFTKTNENNNDNLVDYIVIISNPNLTPLPPNFVPQMHHLFETCKTVKIVESKEKQEFVFSIVDDLETIQQRIKNHILTEFSDLEFSIQNQAIKIK